MDELADIPMADNLDQVLAEGSANFEAGPFLSTCI